MNRSPSMKSMCCLLVVATMSCRLIASAVAGDLIYRNVDDQFVEGVLINKNTGARFTSTTGVTVQVCKDGDWDPGGNSVSVEEADQFKYILTQSESDCDRLIVAIDHADAVQPVLIHATPLYGSAGRLEGNVTQWKGENVPTANVDGVPKVDVTHVLGDDAGVITGAVPANVTELGGDATAAGNALAAFDGTGYNVGGGKIAAVDATGYNNVLHVGPNEEYASINAAEADAEAGDLIVVHPNTYTDTLIGDLDRTYYLARGAILDGSGGNDANIFDGATARFTVLGHGTFRPGTTDNNRLIEVQSSFGEITIEGDVLADADLIGGTKSMVKLSDGAPFTLKVRRIRASFGPALIEVLANTTANVSSQTMELQVALAKMSHQYGTLNVISPSIRFLGDNVVDPASSGGRVVLTGVLICVGDGLNAPSGVTVVANAGGVVVPAGEQSLYGSGTILVGDAFAYDASSVTATNVVRNPATSSVLVNTTILSKTSQTVFRLTAGPPDNDALNGAVIVVTDTADSTQKAVGIVQDYTGSTHEVTLAGSPSLTFTVAPQDKVDVIASKP